MRYSKTNEIPDEEAIPTPDTPTQKLLSVKGKLIIGHETRSFTSEGDSTDYWIVDKTGELLQSMMVKQKESKMEHLYMWN